MATAQAGAGFWAFCRSAFRGEEFELQVERAGFLLQRLPFRRHYQSVFIQRIESGCALFDTFKSLATSSIL